MPPSGLPRNEKLAGDWLEAKWLASSKTKFFELSKTALRWPPVSYTLCFADVDPEKLHKVTYGSSSELDNTLHNIYAEHGAVDLQVRGRDRDGKYYLKCSQPGNKHAPAKAVICVSQAEEKKGRVVAAKTEPSESEEDEWVLNREDWEEVVNDEVVEVEDDWVKVQDP